MVVFIIGTLINLSGGVSNGTWLKFWEVYIWIYLAVSIIVTIWFPTGGLINLREMVNALRTMRRDHSDSGFVGGKKETTPAA